MYNLNTPYFLLGAFHG